MTATAAPYSPFVPQPTPSNVSTASPFAAPSTVPTPSSMSSPFAPPPAVPIPAQFDTSFAAAPVYNSTVPPPAPVEQPPPVPNSFATLPPTAAPVYNLPLVQQQPPPVPEQPPVAPTAIPQLSMAPKDAGFGSNANDAFAKFASMDQFDLVKPKVRAENPFDTPVQNNTAPAPVTTLASMKAMNGDQTEKKEVMKTNAMVMSSA